MDCLRTKFSKSIVFFSMFKKIIAMIWKNDCNDCSKSSKWYSWMIAIITWSHCNHFFNMFFFFVEIQIFLFDWLWKAYFFHQEQQFFYTNINYYFAGNKKDLLYRMFYFEQIIEMNISLCNFSVKFTFKMYYLNSVRM